ncbi:MAG: sialate O-acetylesterase [Treponema sp.]|nr:sialate O-acetylesterase [Treponema sp.]
MNDKLFSPLIGSGMIIQRDSPFPIWSSKKITAVFLGKTYEAQESNQNKKNKWHITLDPVQAGGPYEMEIFFGDEQIKLNDIYSGDVWLCSGQSNMEMQMARLRDNFGEEWDELRLQTPGSKLPVIRHFKVAQEYDFAEEREDMAGGKWVTVSSDTLEEFSGTAWFFAKELYTRYGIPIGLINTAWGGTPVESWMSKEALSDFPEKIAEAKQFADKSKVEEISNNALSKVNEWHTLLDSEDLGLIQNWKDPQTDISEWKDILMPENFANAAADDPNLKNFCGSIWLSKDFTASSELASSSATQFAKVWLGTITDADTVYINGVKIGDTTYRYPPRKYKSNGTIKQGINRIVIRITIINGDGGITKNKPFRIFTDNASAELEGIWKYKIGASIPSRPAEYFFSRHPVGNYNAIVSPLLKYPFKGMIWYQGESNGQNVSDYAKLFKLMIEDYRKRNGKEFPFFFVQLPVFGSVSDNDENSNWALIREAQSAALSLPLTAIVCALDLGEWNDLHPLNKKDVGVRLFYAAEKLIGEVENTSPGPTFREQRTGSSERIILRFDNCGGGLTTKAPALSLREANRGFDASVRDENPDTAYVTVIGEDGNHRLPVKIENADSISIDISSVKNPSKILYAWADNPRDRQLYNNEGLPMLPFKIKI